MGIQVNDFEIERKVNRAISQFPASIKPTKQQFMANAVTAYIDTLVKERIIRSMWTYGDGVAVLIMSMDASSPRNLDQLYRNDIGSYIIQ